MTGVKRKKKSAVCWKIYALRCEDIKLWCLRRFPILEWATNYNVKENLIPDAISGMMLAIQQVTQGLAFAVLSSVHPVFGLYGSLFPVIIYAIFGMGRHVATGTFALTSLISANAVERLVPLSSNNFTTSNNSGVLGLSEFEMKRIGVAAAVSFLGGIIQVTMFVLHLGSATFLLTEPVISAMTTGAATHVVTSQVKYLLGMKMPYISGPLGFFYIYAYIFENIKSVQLEALLLSLLSIVVLVLVKELNEKFKRIIKVILPIDLVLIIATSLACYYADMEYTYGLEVVGHIPEGMPPLKAPTMNVLSEVITEAFGVALVGYVASLALAKASAKKFRYSVDDNQEFLAHGLSNVIPSFFFCIPSAAAMGRTALLYSTGAKTQVACLISCIFILVVIYAMGPMLYWLPMCVLASIIVVGLKGMLMQFRDLKKYWNVDKIDWESLQQVKIVSVNNPLVFLNAKKFHADLIKIIQKDNASNQAYDDINKCEQNTLLNPLSNGSCHGESSVEPCPNERCAFILDCSGLTLFDYTGVSVLLQIYMDCKNQNINVLLAHCKASLIKAMQYSDNLGSENPIFFESVSSAVGAIQINRNFSKLNEHSEV
ncbi:anion exchange transporter isoform X2 [Alligator mississippiensis]|uniref:anion exchange transporter isoform X2 n=1 Tax=Alligator mississippiensis TaxID=8496 RepID=UPI000907372D|nr:anion exchange transporter isoform X2 [Alligator mississippiensis]